MLCIETIRDNFFIKQKADRLSGFSKKGRPKAALNSHVKLLTLVVPAAAAGMTAAAVPGGR